MKRILLAASALIVVAATSSAFAEDGGNGNGNGKTNRATVTGTGQLTVFQPITLAQTQGLDFGAITSGANGTVTIAQANGTRSVSGGVGAIAVNVGKTGAFDVKGQADAAINVVVGSDITGFAGGIKGKTQADNLPVALKGSSASFNVGGSLDIPASTPAGAYTGEYTVSVNYP